MKVVLKTWTPFGFEVSNSKASFWTLFQIQKYCDWYVIEEVSRSTAMRVYIKKRELHSVMKFLIWKLAFRHYFKFKNTRTGTYYKFLRTWYHYHRSLQVVLLSYCTIPSHSNSYPQSKLSSPSIISRTTHAQSQLQLFAFSFDAFDLPIVRGSVTGGTRSIGTSKNAFVACASVYFA